MPTIRQFLDRLVQALPLLLVVPLFLRSIAVVRLLLAPCAWYGLQRLNWKLGPSVPLYASFTVIAIDARGVKHALQCNRRGRDEARCTLNCRHL